MYVWYRDMTSDEDENDEKRKMMLNAKSEIFLSCMFHFIHVNYNVLNVQHWLKKMMAEHLVTLAMNICD